MWELSDIPEPPAFLLEDVPGGFRLSMRGEIDMAARVDLAAVVEVLDARADRAVVIDLGAVVFLGVAEGRQLTEAQVRAHDADKSFRVTGAARIVRTMFAASGLPIVLDPVLPSLA